MRAVGPDGASSFLRAIRESAQAFGGIWDACLDEAASRDLIHHAAEELKK